MKGLQVQEAGILPKEIQTLLQSLDRIGFFSHSLLAGSWIFPLYQALFNTRYALKTFDIDFAVDLISLSRAKPVNLEILFQDLGYLPVIDYASGLRKYTRGGFEIEFLVQRKGDRDPDHIPLRRLNVTATPLPFLDVLFQSALTIRLGDFTIRMPRPESLFIHKLIVAQRRKNSIKKENDLSQCQALIPVLEPDKLQKIL